MAFQMSVCQSQGLRLVVALVPRAFQDQEVEDPVVEAKPQVLDFLQGHSFKGENFVGTVSSKAEEVLDIAKKKWAATKDKPTVITTGIVALLGLYIASGVVERIDDIPGVGNVFQLVGFLSTIWFATRYLSSDEGRNQINSQLKTFLERLGFD